MEMEMPKPGPAHAQLAKLAGDWSGDETIHPSPMDPVGGKAFGRVTNRLSLDGFVVVQDFEQTRNGQVCFKGHGVFSVDPASGKPVMHWWDNAGGWTQLFRGDWNGDVLSLSSQDQMGHLRCTFDVKGNGYKFHMEFSQDGKQWMPFMSGSYRKG